MLRFRYAAPRHDYVDYAPRGVAARAALRAAICYD